MTKEHEQQLKHALDEAATRHTQELQRVINEQKSAANDKIQELEYQIAELQKKVEEKVRVFLYLVGGILPHFDSFLRAEVGC